MLSIYLTDIKARWVFRRLAFISYKILIVKSWYEQYKTFWQTWYKFGKIWKMSLKTLLKVVESLVEFGQLKTKIIKKFIFYSVIQKCPDVSTFVTMNICRLIWIDFGRLKWFLFVHLQLFSLPTQSKSIKFNSHMSGNSSRQICPFWGTQSGSDPKKI